MIRIFPRLSGGWNGSHQDGAGNITVRHFEAKTASVGDRETFVNLRVGVKLADNEAVENLAHKISAGSLPVACLVLNFICGTRLGREFIHPKPNYDLVPSEAALRRSLKGVANHEPREHKPESLLRYMILKYGQRDHLGRVDRLDPCLPAKTVIAGGTKGGGRSHLHPHIPRTMTARESARLQTFPDDYIFLGPSARQFTQVGNAVPPVLAAQLGDCIFRSFFQKRK